MMIFFDRYAQLILKSPADLCCIAACNFDGRRYKDGEVFSPNGDPCDYCTCEVIISLCVKIKMLNFCF